MPRPYGMYTPVPASFEDHQPQLEQTTGPPPNTPATGLVQGKAPSSKATDDMLPFPIDVHNQMCHGLEDDSSSWMLLLDQLEKRGATFTRSRSLRRKSRNCADGVIRRLYGEKDAESANQLLLDSLAVMRRADILELLLEHIGMPRSTAAIPGDGYGASGGSSGQISEDNCAL